MNPHCVFCQIIKNETYEEKANSVVRFAPLNPVTPGHMLFVPTHHVEYPLNDPYSLGTAFQEAAKYGQRLNEQFNLITSNGPMATQTILHPHVHYIPRTANDGLTLPWTDTQRHDTTAHKPASWFDTIVSRISTYKALYRGPDTGLHP